MKREKILCFLFGLLLVIPNFIDFRFECPSEKPLFEEEFEPDLVSMIRSMDELETLADLHGYSPESLYYWNNVAGLIRKRFYHSYSVYSTDENWIAAVSGWIASPLLGLYFQYPVLPDDILKHPMASCSQQGIVLQALMKRRGISYKTVEYHGEGAGHYAVAALIEGEWYYFDTNKEYLLIDGNRAKVAQIMDVEYRCLIYPKMDCEDVKAMGEPILSEENPPLAPMMSLFHQVSWFLSKSLWLIFLCVWFFYERIVKII